MATVKTNSSLTAVTVGNGKSSSSKTLQNKIDDSVMRIKEELYKETGIFLKPHYATSSSTTTLNQLTTGLTVNISKGSSATDSIKYAQILLKELKFYDGEVNGIFDEKLRQTVIKFQRLSRLSVTGKIDKKTWGEMNNKIYSGYVEKREHNKKVLMEALANIPKSEYRGKIPEVNRTEKRVVELMDTMEEFGIDDTLELKVLLAQAIWEVMSREKAVENKDTGYNGEDKKYAGGGFLQITFAYSYQAFAINEIIHQCPELEEDELLVTPANTSAKTIEKNYEELKESAEKLKINIKQYTDIYELGNEYVAEHYAWKSAGWYWNMKGIGKKIEWCTEEEAMKISTNIINPGAYGKSYDNRVKSIAQVNAVSELLEELQW